ncbi:MAG: hypothetical protein M1818_002428 [Claussenomyces sp. TS43310]|nr:MAG: hypothetical protein M1818_002428 [Claussenomyces sp. TS43310]
MSTVRARIVRLDGIYAALKLPCTWPHEYIEHAVTQSSEVTERIKDADIVISTRSPLDRSAVAAWARAHDRPKLLAVMAVGTDTFDLDACRAHGVVVSNVPAASNEAVAEHAMALFFAARRKVVRMHRVTVEDQVWRQKGTPVDAFGPLPGTCGSEILGIVGAGDLGNRIAVIARALGMTVLTAERKGIPESGVRPGRIAFPVVLQRSTALVLTCPLDASTRGMIDEPELRLMRSDSVLVNVARGGIVAEDALVKALRQGWIEGAATDVFVEEPAGLENSLLVRALREDGGLNLTLSPHVAWYARSSAEKLQRTVVANIEAFMAGEAQNVVA